MFLSGVWSTHWNIRQEHLLYMKIELKYNEEDIVWQVVGQDEYKRLMEELKPSKRLKLHTNNLKVHQFLPNNWITYDSRYTKDIVYIVVNRDYKLYGYKCNVCVGHVDMDISHQAIPALRHVKDKFSELTNSTFKTSFGTVEEEILRCVPKQLYWSQNESYRGIANGIDISSHYPSQLCGILPDSHTAIRFKGTKSPTKEYPFAFYVKSGHLAIYKELDTHTWLFNRKLTIKDLFRLKTVRSFDDTFHDIPYEEDETILMKASEHTLKEVMEYFYNIKETYPHDSHEYEVAKLALNASIGQMHRKLYVRDKYAHLCAVCIARANQKMLNLLNIISEDIIQIQVDGIIYKEGKTYGINDKYLGANVQEFTNRPIRWDSLGNYMVDMGGTFKIKCQGCNSMKDGRKPQESNCFEDMDLWIKE